MEAMACRTPVVSTNTGWPSEAIKSGWNGILVVSEMSPRLPMVRNGYLFAERRSLEGTVRQRLCYGHGGSCARVPNWFEEA